MGNSRFIKPLVLIVVAALLIGAAISALFSGDWRAVALLAAASTTCFVGWQVAYRRNGAQNDIGRKSSFASSIHPWASSLASHSQDAPTPADTTSGAPSELHRVEDAEDIESLVQTMLKQHRYALLLRPQVEKNLDHQQFERAFAALREAMTLTPHGEVLMRGRYSQEIEAREASALDQVAPVEALYLDRFAVTNEQFYEFVAAGGYEQMSLWRPEIWPAVLDYVDRTGRPGPRFWRNGRFAKGEAQHPVVGVSWYEASAYSRWVGKRLPSDAEWVRAAAWPVCTSRGIPVQRRYPWGDSMDHELANLFCSGVGRPCDVGDFAGGVSVGGAHQMIGNVWEWTADDFGVWDPPERRLQLPYSLKSLRGGAFDTYFDNQATCQFQSGENPMNRRHNIGFRCVAPLNELSLRPKADGGQNRIGRGEASNHRVEFDPNRKTLVSDPIREPMREVAQ